MRGGCLYSLDSICWFFVDRVQGGSNAEYVVPSYIWLSRSELRG
jgi:hypothetical protein